MDLVTQRSIAQAGKEVDPGWYRVHRRVSIHLTRAALALGMVADQASLAMMVCGLVGAALLVPQAPLVNAVGFVVLYLAFLLDKVDGELARLQGTQNARGIFLDRMHHRLVEPCLFLAVAVHEHLRSGSLAPLVAGFATMLLANAIEENQHLAAYILYKRTREGERLPDGVPPPRSPAWARAALVLRPLKGFRMFIVALPLLALSYIAAWLTARPAPTFVLVASACGLAVYLAFQCLHYLNEKLESEIHAIAGVLRTGVGRAAARPISGDIPTHPANEDLMTASRLRVGSLLALIATVVAAAGGVAVPARAAGTFYVNGASATCSDSGPGTLGTPYCTIGGALTAQAGPGTTIRVAPGVYKEQVTVPASGEAGNPLVIQGDGTDINPVIVEGSEPFDQPALWSRETGTTWLAASVDWVALMVLVDGARLVPWVGAADSVPDGGFKYVPGSGLYVNLGTGGPAGNPGKHETFVGRRTHGVFVNNRAWVTIRGLRIQRTNDRGIQITNSNNIGVHDNVIERVQRFGIQAQGSSAVLIQRNRTTENGDHGIILSAGTTASLVDSNESDGNARPGVRAANGIYLFGAPGNVIRRNRLHHNQDTGLHVQGGSDSTLSYQNVSWANGDHGFDHLSVTGSIHLSDVAYDNFKDGFSFEGGTEDQRMHNCISSSNGATTGRYDLFVDSSSVFGHISNDNIFWNANGQPPVKFGKIAYASVAAYTSATGQDTRSIEGDPRFVAPGIGDFHLLGDSPAIDAANTALPEWPGVDAEGFAPIDHPAVANTGIGPVTYADRGAYEFGSGGIIGVPTEPSPVATLEGVTPNPLRGRGQLSFRTSRAGPLAVDLFDARGRHVRRVLSKDNVPAGLVVAPIEDRGEGGQTLPAGIYLYRVRTVDGERGGKFVIVR